MTEYSPHEPPPETQAQPYAQPDAQPYAQAPWQQQAAPPAAWGAPPAPWAAPVEKKRKAWPWVLGAVGALVVLGGIGFAVVYGVNGVLTADQNENYVGDPIAAEDAPLLGDALIVSEDGAVAFEIGAEWVDAGEYVDMGELTSQLPDGARAMGTYFTVDPFTATVIPTMVIVLEGEPPSQIGAVDLEEAHRGAFEGVADAAAGQGVDTTREGPTAVTTAQGLDGLLSTMSFTMDDVPVQMSLHTFVRGERVVWVQVATYTGEEDAGTVALVTDSLRIDK
ncbi:hypothetical protein LGT39_12345 [Demequina sp. TTPB684]|uniref:hypothetical protein n=1 Tax=unclassified Demequina TaxID=2620311 RepID=UPI001CF4F585|nr:MULTISPECIES: hypothetical protein [unclassified Demequina]MCB2413634.1 hypothetical protein [Demequina sp. TTPB684]UPU88243.1 hypothetical protein LGT36_013530 [Demequina sp. TMPB413]